MKFIRAIGFSLLFWFTVAPIRAQPLDDGVYATIYAEGNQFVIDLKYSLTPLTVANFVGLAEGTIHNDAFPPGRPFFDGSSFSRVVPGHVLQGGIPASKEASSTGYSLPDEIHPDLSHDKAGIVGMANSGPHTANNIFYVTLGDRSYLDGDYTVFGEVICYDTYDIPLNTQIDSIRIIRVGNAAEQYHPDDSLFKVLLEKVNATVAQSEKIKHDEETLYIETHYPELVTSEQGWQYQILAKGKGKPVRKLKEVQVRFTGLTPQGLAFESKSDGSTSWTTENSPGEYFSYPAATSINSGFDQAIAEMRKGSRSILVLRSEYAYGTSGYYPPQRESEKRFHFSPNTTLIYHVEIKN